MTTTKKALLIGINYVGQSGELRGCVNDVNHVKEYLLKNSYKRGDVTVMTDTGRTKPTRVNIINALLKLVMCGAEQLYFHYSGHGAWQRDTNEDEVDSRDETLVPVDYTTNGMITDDQLRGLLAFLPSTSRMTVVLDCCHSGTGMDLAYTFKEVSWWTRRLQNKRWIRELHKECKMVKDPGYKHTEGDVIIISGCLDNQTSADSFEEGCFQGALTYSLLKTLQDPNAKDLCWEELIKNVRGVLQGKRYTQIANLTSGKPLDIKEVVKFC